jgi:hypothetical protein
MVPEERKADDDRMYTQQTFEEMYDGLDEWDAAESTATHNPETECGKFFKNINDTVCFNWEYAPRTKGDQWCYVSSKCTALGSGQNVNADLSYKTCTKKDKLSAETTLYQLQYLARLYQVDMITLAKWSYVVPGKYEEMGDEYIKKAKASGIIQLFESETGEAPYKVIPGNVTVQQLSFGDDKLKGMGVEGLYYIQWLGGLMDAVYCLEECWTLDWLR